MSGRAAAFTCSPRLGRVSDYRILPRFYARQEEAERQRRIARILLETGETVPARVTAGATLAGDRSRLRGLPAVGKGIGQGAIRGTTPGRNLD